MRFFSKSKKSERLLAVAVQGDGVCAASIRRRADALPEVKLATFYPADEPRSKELFDKLGREFGGGLYRCSAVLSQGEYQLLAVEAPAVPQEELKTAVRWRLKDMIDFPVDQATVDVLNIPADKAGGRANNIFAIAARNSVIETRQNLFVDAKLDLQVIDIPEMAQRNISALLEPEGRGIAMLSFGADGGLLTVTYNGELYLSRRMDVPVEQLLDEDHDRKHACFDRITLELQRSLDHFERQYSFITVAKLVLAPTGASGLEEYLSSNLYTRVETLDLASVLDLAGAPELAKPASQQRFFLALGAALRHDKASA
jgi:MSHA biogenesis protein MshI